MDVRAGGKGYEEFVQRAMEEERVIYIRGRVAQVYQEDGKLVVARRRTRCPGKQVEVEADMVVLATADAHPPTTAGAGAHAADRHRRPRLLHGGAPQAAPGGDPDRGHLPGRRVRRRPKDIPDTVSQASAAAAKGMELLSHDFLERDPTTAQVDQAACVGCFECFQVCPYGAIEKQEVRDREGNLVRMVAWSNPAMCEGCGLCTVTCRGGFIDLAGYSDEQVFAQLGALGPLPEVLGR